MPSFIGTGADQVPVNSMLGSLAYQNADDVKLGKVTYSGDLSGNGNIGVGVTPRQWSTSWKAVEVGSGGALSGDSGVGVHVSSNGYWTGSNWIYNATGYACDYYQSAGTHVWRYSPSGSAGTTITWTQAMTLDASGNLGLGVIPNAWLTGGGFIQVPGNGFIGNNTSMSSNSMLLGSNAYFDTTWKYRTSSLAATFFQAGNGTFSWYTAPTGTAGATVTFTQVMSLDSSNLILSGTGATKLQEGTTAQRPASPQEGMIRKNSTDSDMEFYCAGNWEKVNNNLLNVRLFTTVGSQQTITLDPRTNYIIAEMIGGGGSGGSIPAGPYATNNVSVNASGSPGAAVKVLIPKSAITSTTMYYYIGDGGGFSVAGNNGGNTVLSFDPIANDTNRIIAYGGIAAPGPSPVGLPPRSVSKQSPPSEVSFNGVMTNCKLLEHSNTYGYGVTVLANPLSINMIVTNHNAGYNGVQSHSGISWGYAAAALGLVGGTFFQFGAGGRGGYGSQAEGAYVQGSSGFQGMIRIYEYS